MPHYVKVTIETDAGPFTVLLDSQTRVSALNVWLRRIGAKRVTVGPTASPLPVLPPPAPARRYACNA